MQQLSIQLNTDLTAQVHYFFLRPYTLSYSEYNESKYQIRQTNGEVQEFKSIEDVIKHIENEMKSKDIVAIPKMTKVVFLQRKYRKRALELISGDMRLINNALKDVAPLTFSEAQQVLEFCLPDPAY